LTEAVAAVPPDLASARPQPHKWSVVECVEHVIRAEAYLLAQLVAGTPGAPTANHTREERIVAVATDRSRAISAPAVSHPTGHYTTLPAAMNALVATRARTLAFIEQFQGDFHAWRAMHPLAGQVNGYELLLMIAMHPLRHAQQVTDTCRSLSAL
jgi:hypothetical protein